MPSVSATIGKCLSVCRRTLRTRKRSGGGQSEQRSIHVRGLGQRAPDAAIWAFAQQGGGTIVTRIFLDTTSLWHLENHMPVCSRSRR